MAGIVTGHPSKRLYPILLSRCVQFRDKYGNSSDAVSDRYLGYEGSH